MKIFYPLSFILLLKHVLAISLTNLDTGLLSDFTLAQNSPNVTDHLSINGPHLFGQTLSYCSEEQTILVARADFVYFAGNHSLAIDIAGRSAAGNLSLGLNLTVYDYGHPLLEKYIDLCSILDGILCPLPSYGISQRAIITLPDSIVKKIPSIAYTVPNLDVIGRLELIDVNTGELATCIQTTISNRQTVQQVSVSAVVGVLLVFATVLLLPLHRLVFPYIYEIVPPDWIFISVTMYLQHIASSAGLLSIPYPTVLRPFASNFAFMLGLIPIPAIESSIGKTDNSTGGLSVAGLDVDDEGFMNPYGIIYDYSPAEFSKRGVSLSSIGTGVVVDTVMPSKELTNRYPSGISSLLNSISIDPTNGYLTTIVIYFIFVSLLIATVLSFFLISTVNASLRERLVGSQKTRFHGSLHLLHAMLFKSFFMLFFPLCCLTFDTWAIVKKDAGIVAVVFSVVSFIILSGIMSACIYWIMKRPNRSPISLKTRFNLKFEDNTDSEEFDGSHVPACFTWLYAEAYLTFIEPLRKNRWWFFLVFVGIQTLEVIFAGFLQGHGTAQEVSILLLSTVLFAAVFTYKPLKWRFANFVAVILTGFKFIAHIMMVPFISEVQGTTSGIGRAADGFLLIGIFGVGILLLLYVTWRYIIKGSLIKWRQWRQSKADDKERENAVIEREKEEKWKNEFLQVTAMSVDSSSSIRCPSCYCAIGGVNDAHSARLSVTNAPGMHSMTSLATEISTQSAEISKQANTTVSEVPSVPPIPTTAISPPSKIPPPIITTPMTIPAIPAAAHTVGIEERPPIPAAVVKETDITPPLPISIPEHVDSEVAAQNTSVEENRAVKTSSMASFSSLILSPGMIGQLSMASIPESSVNTINASALAPAQHSVNGGKENSKSLSKTQASNEMSHTGSVRTNPFVTTTNANPFCLNENSVEQKSVANTHDKNDPNEQEMSFGQAVTTPSLKHEDVLPPAIESAKSTINSQDRSENFFEAEDLASDVIQENNSTTPTQGISQNNVNLSPKPDITISDHSTDIPGAFS